MKPFIRPNHASAFDWSVELGHSDLSARARSPRNLQVAMASMLVFAAVAGSAALHWANRTPTSTGDEFTRAVSPATAPLPGEPRFLASTPPQATDRARPGAADGALETSPTRPLATIAPVPRYGVQLSWQPSEEAAVARLLTTPDLHAKFPSLLGDPASAIREAGRDGPVSRGGFTIEQATDFCKQFRVTGGDCRVYEFSR